MLALGYCQFPVLSLSLWGGGGYTCSLIKQIDHSHHNNNGKLEDVRYVWRQTEKEKKSGASFLSNTISYFYTYLPFCVWSLFRRKASPKSPLPIVLLVSLDADDLEGEGGGTKKNGTQSLSKPANENLLLLAPSSSGPN